MEFFAEPTNHLDLEACVWLEETLKQFKRILLLISHSQVSSALLVQRCSHSHHIDLATQFVLMQLVPIVSHACSDTVCAMTVRIATKLSSFTPCTEKHISLYGST